MTPKAGKPQLELLQDYPFQKLAILKRDLKAPASKSHIALSIGEPQHPAPDFVLDILHQQRSRYRQYPATKGLIELRLAIADWLQRRYQLPTDAIDVEQHVLPLGGSREGLFAIAQCLIDPAEQPLVMMPNPFYQIYEGAALLAGGKPYFMDCGAESGFLPDLDKVSAADWQRCQLLYLCSPGNPCGAVASLEYLQRLLALAEQYNFNIVSDECYSEIYSADNRPAGLLQACIKSGNQNYERCLVMNSLSKRSNLAGLRSGFVAGDAELLRKFLLYRTYHGNTLPVPTQLASAAAWADEQHVAANRAAYQRKFSMAEEILAPCWPQTQPDAAFFLWPETPIDDQTFCQRLYSSENVTLLPGSFLSRPTTAGDPGANRVRMALVAEQAECREALERIALFVSTL